MLRLEFSHRIVKEPILTFYAQDLLRTFPNAQFVFIVRDPRDNIRSILNRLKLPGDQMPISTRQWSNVPAAWREVVENRRLGFSFDNHVESLAARWLHAWRVCSSAGNRMITVRYEDFVADKLGFIHGLARRVGLPLRATNLKTIHKQFQHRGDREVTWPTFFGRNLAVINSVCRAAMPELRYELHHNRAEWLFNSMQSTSARVA